MAEYAIPISCFAGILFYIYNAWLAPDRDNPSSSAALLKNALAMFLIAAAFALLFVLPWTMFYGWSVHDVVTANVPKRIDTAVYAIYASCCAGLLALVHAGVANACARWRARASNSD